MSPLELIGGVIALGLMGGGLKLYQMNRKRSELSLRIIDETPKKKTVSKRKKTRRPRKKK